MQSHHNSRLFTRQLQWAMQECERYLTGERTLAQHRELSADAAPQIIQVVAVRDKAAAEDAEADASEEVDIEEMQAAAASANISDDYVRRGATLQTMSFYAYRMFVKRVAEPSRAKCQSPTVFRFEEGYALAAMRVQEVSLHAINTPNH